jgi:hypothetical protein
MKMENDMKRLIWKLKYFANYIIWRLTKPQKSKEIIQLEKELAEARRKHRATRHIKERMKYITHVQLKNSYKSYE